MAVGFTWTNCQPELSILNPFQIILMILARLGNLVGQNMAWKGKTRPWPPSQACRFRNFFLGPIPELLFCTFFVALPGNFSNNVDRLTRRSLLSFLEMQQISLGQRGRHYLRKFLEMLRKNAETSSGMGPRKKFPNLRALLGGPGHVSALQATLWPRSDFQVGPETSKMVRNGSRIDASG